MKRINKILTPVLCCCLLSVLFSGCTDWLRVDPYDKTLDKEVYKSESQIQAAHNGLYNTLAKNSLYGRNLSNGAVELLAQRYAVPDAAENYYAQKYYLSRYTYDEAVVKNMFNAVWSEAYNAILGINYFITRLSMTEGVVSESDKNLLLGEAYALRAYMHFDLLRLFGPVYSAYPDAVSIPYYTTPEIKKVERLTARTVASKVLADLELALDYLGNDPILRNGLGKDMDKGSARFYYESDRNFRMNYYAVTALKARLLLYMGFKSEASATVMSLLTSVEDLFPWTEMTAFTAPGSEDRIFSTEVIFGVYAGTMYSNWSAYFSGDITDLSALYGATEYNLRNVFETTGMALSSDLRARNWVSYNANTSYMYPRKFARTTEAMPFTYFQPMIRKSELYYILAECEQDLSYIETVKTKRNSALSAASLSKQLELEYAREFYGEGQLFYFYKRNNYAQIVSGQNLGELFYVSMTLENYMPPIPEQELQN